MRVVSGRNALGADAVIGIIADKDVAHVFEISYVLLGGSNSCSN